MSDYITGVDELLSKLQSLSKKDAKKAIRTGCRAGAKIIQQTAKRNAPERTGTLQSGVKVRAITRSRVWSGSKITLQVPYASFVELGAPHHDQAAQHFMQKAAKQDGDSALDKAVDIIEQEIIKAANGS